MHDVPVEVGSQISVDTIKLLHAIVVQFVAEVMERAIVQREQERIAKRAARKEARVRGEFDVGDSPPASRESSEEPPPVSLTKKRGAPRKSGKVDKRKADEASLDGLEPPPKKRSRPGKVTETLSREDRDTIQKIMDNVHEALQDRSEVLQSQDSVGHVLWCQLCEAAAANGFQDAGKSDNASARGC